MSSTVSAPFKLELRCLRWQFALAVGALIAVTVVPWLIQGLAPSIRVLSSAGGVLAVVVGLYPAGWLSPRQHLGLVRDSTGEWQIIEGERAVLATLHSDSRCFRHFVWLRFIGSRSALIGPGDLDPDLFRRLKVVLRGDVAASLRERVA